MVELIKEVKSNSEDKKIILYAHYVKFLKNLLFISFLLIEVIIILLNTFIHFENFESRPLISKIFLLILPFVLIWIILVKETIIIKKKNGDLIIKQLRPLYLSRSEYIKKEDNPVIITQEKIIPSFDINFKEKSSLRKYRVFIESKNNGNIKRILLEPLLFYRFFFTNLLPSGTIYNMNKEEVEALSKLLEIKWKSNKKIYTDHTGKIENNENLNN